jgi:hypothetical protein
MKAKLLSFVFICFSESGLFKGLRAKKIKKFDPSQLASQVAQQAPQTDIQWIASFWPSCCIWPSTPKGALLLQPRASLSFRDRDAAT